MRLSRVGHHLTVPYRPLVADAAKGIGAPDLAGNLVIHGDNLHALKSLLPRHAGAVDLIFIDPPYNTGNEGWCYSYGVNSPIMKEWLSTNPVDGEDMLRRGGEQEDRYVNADDDTRGPWTSSDYTCNKTTNERPILCDSIRQPNTSQDVWPSRNRVRAYDRSVHAQSIQDRALWWGADGKAHRPRLKRFRSDVQEGTVPSTS